ncbi:hypothetical protein USDA257_p04190 (plasmid) [Sinorhizobium fredii USDA 257]|uniref:Uncharacterized protein n=1 Tax=Sinorhizobium fredii (strain USDA 257) TaxID=1185652 RepID=I3XGX8_SINF2|nr:hypothetical protein USDA257_p04190 [Sinorhizobium fredii USDA 257]
MFRGDAKALALRQGLRRLRHVIFDAQDLSRGEDRRLRRPASLRVNLLRLQQHQIVRGHKPRADIDEVHWIVDVAMQRLGDIPLFEGGAFAAELLQQKLGIGDQPVGHLLSARKIGRREIHFDALARERRLLRPEMFLCDAVKALLGIGAAVEPDLMPGKRKMPIGGFRPGDLPCLHGFLIAGPELVDDLSVRPVRRDDTQRLAVFAKHRHLLRPEPLLRQGPERRHQMDMRIAVLVVIDPVRDHAFGRQIVPDELAHQGDVLRPGQFFGQRDDQLPGKLRVRSCLVRLHRIPERLARLGDGLSVDRRLQPARDLVRQRQFLMHQFRGPTPVAEGRAGLLVHHPGAMAIGGGRDDASPRSPADHLRSDEHDRHDRLQTSPSTSRQRRILRPQTDRTEGPIPLLRKTAIGRLSGCDVFGMIHTSLVYYHFPDSIIDADQIARTGKDIPEWPQNHRFPISTPRSKSCASADER